MKYAIYGDGVRDDYYGIQAMLDQGAAEVTLPMPESNYRISKTLKIHSGQKLKLPRIIGMLVTGIVLGPYVLDLLDPSILSISADLRKMVNDILSGTL